MKILFENWRKHLAEERSIEKKLGELFWSNGAHGVLMAQSSDKPKLAAKMIETVDKIKVVIKMIDQELEETIKHGEPDPEAMDKAEYKANEDFDSEEQPYHGEEWWDWEKYERLYDPILYDATHLPWFIVPTMQTEIPDNLRVTPEEAKEAYDYIKKWAGIK